MEALLWSIVATLIVSSIAFIGVLSLLIKEKLLERILILLVGFSAGALMGGAFLHLIPEAAEKSGFDSISLCVIIGFTLFFLMERILHWHHCHKKGGKCDIHTFTYMNLIGDGVHNFIDGLIIAAGFVVSINLGIATTIAVISHEIPQEISDFGVLVYGGFSRIKAIVYNFLSAVVAVLGAIAGFFVSSSAWQFTAFLVPFAAGGFIYVAASDLIPELHKEPRLSKSMLSFAFFLLGLLFMFAVKLVFE